MRSWHHYLRSALFVPVLATAWFLPRAAQRWLARVTARFVYVLAPRLRRRLEKNQRRARSEELEPEKVRAAVLAVLTNYGHYLLDFLALKRGRRHDLMRECIGSDRLVTASALQRGAILVTAHIGSWEMAALFLADRARSMTLVSAPEEIGYLGELRSTIRSRQSHDELLVGNDPMAALALLTKLRAGGMVGMQLDRAASGAWSSVPFCGARLKMPRGPARLAHASEAPLVPVFALFGIGGGYDLVVEEPIDPAGLSEAEITARLAAVLERQVRAHPEQWLMMQDPWDEDAGPAEVAEPASEAVRVAP